MEAVLGILLAVAVIAVIVLSLQASSARSVASRTTAELESLRNRFSALEADSRRIGESLESKRRENEELKERLRDAKRRRQEERESERFQRDLQRAREELERDMEKRLAKAREEAEEARAALRRVQAELDAARARRPAPAQPAGEAARAEPPPRVREVKPEELARLESAEKALKEARERINELEAEARKLRGRSETDRRVFLVQRSELDLAKDRFRALESRYNALALERDELRRSLFALEKEMRELRPAPEPSPEPAAEAPAATAEPGDAQAPAAQEGSPEGAR